MALKRPGFIAAAIWSGLLAFVLIGSAVVVSVHLITAVDWHDLDFGPTVILGAGFVFFVLGVLAVPFGAIARAQRFAAAASGDATLVPLTPTQPDQTLALRDGETLTFGRQRTSSSFWGSLLIAFLMAILGLMWEALVLPLVPAIGQRAFNPLYDARLYTDTAPPPPPSFLDWFTVIFPVAFLGLLTGFIILWLFREKRQQISADDQGITLRSLLRRRFIPWHDLLLFVHLVNTPTEHVQGAYWLVGREHFLPLTIHSHVATLPRKKWGRQVSQEEYRYDGGYEAYQMAAQRLIATIAMRGVTPMRTVVPPRSQRRLAARFQFATLTLDKALAAPIADAVPQPHAADPGMGTKIHLKIQYSFWILLPEALLVLTLAMLEFTREVYASAAAPSATISILAALHGDLFSIFTIGFESLFWFLLGLGFAWQRRRGFTSLIADDIGLRNSASSQAPIYPWEAMRAWVMFPQNPKRPKETRYAIVLDGDVKIIWIERVNAALAGRKVRGSRREAYATCVEQLHAMIAARTHLPLRQL